MNIPQNIQKVAAVVPLVALCLGLTGGLYRARQAGQWVEAHRRTCILRQGLPPDRAAEGDRFEQLLASYEKSPAEGGDWAIAAELAGLRELLWIGFSAACAFGLAVEIRRQPPPAASGTSLEAGP